MPKFLRTFSICVLSVFLSWPLGVKAADVWKRPALAPGWTNFGSGYRPLVAVKSGQSVTVSGLVRRTNGKWGHIATLPAGMRPSQRLIFNVNTHERTARVDVLPNGQIHFVVGQTAHNWVSLTGISFSTGRDPSLKLSPGWANYGQGYAGFNAVRAGNTVTVGGLVKPGKGGVIGVLPTRLRPAKRLIFNLNSHDKTSRVDVLPNGQIVWVYRPPSRGWISLNGISFSRKPGKTLKLVGGWRNFGQRYSLANVSRNGNRVTVGGLVKNGRWGHIATLPNGTCPENRLIFNLNNHDGSSRVDVLSDCRIVWVAGAKKHGWINLDGIAFNIGRPTGVSESKIASVPKGGGTADSRMIELAGNLVKRLNIPVIADNWNQWANRFSKEGALLKTTVTIANQSATILIYRPKGRSAINDPVNIAVLVDNLKISNLIRKTQDTFADDLEINHATYIFAPNGNEQNISVNDLPAPVRSQVSKVRTGPISIVSGNNLFALVNARRGGATANFLKQINADLNNLKVHAAYGRRLSKVLNKPVPYNAVRLTRPGTWNKPFKQPDLSITNPTLEYAKIRGRKFVRAWGNGELGAFRNGKKYFVFLQKNLGSAGPFPTAAALDAKFISLRDYINYTTLFSGTIFKAVPQFNDLLNRTRDIPIDEVRIEHPNYRVGSVVDADGNPVFTNVLVMAAAAGDILPDLAETEGQALIAQGRGRIFGIPAGNIRAQILWESKSKRSRKQKTSDMEVDASVNLPKWGKMNLGDFRFYVRRSDDRFVMALDGQASVGVGPIRFNQDIAIKANNSGFEFKIDRSCPLQPYGVSASVNGHKIGTGAGFSLSKTGSLTSCLAGPLDEIAKQLAKGVEFVATNSAIAKSISNDAWAGLSQSVRIPGQPINPKTLTDFTKRYSDPAKALNEVAKKGEMAIKDIGSKIGGLLGGKKKKGDKPKYYIRPKDCGPNDDWNIKWATCWKRGTELIRLASAPHLCLSVNGRKKIKDRAVQIEMCHGDWNQQWTRDGRGNVIHGWGGDGCLEWKKSGRLQILVQNRCNTEKAVYQTFHRDQYDRLVSTQTGRCLQIDKPKDDAFLFLNNCVFQGSSGKAHNYQRWQFKSDDAGTTFKKPLPPLAFKQPDGIFRAIKSVASRACLAAVPFSSSNGTRAQLLSCNFVGAHGSKWQWLGDKIMSQNQKCLGARLHFESAIVEHVDCNSATAAQWTSVLKVGGNVMFKNKDGLCLGVTEDGKPWLWGCNRKSKYVLFSYR